MYAAYCPFSDYELRVISFYALHLKSEEKAQSFFDEVVAKTTTEHPYRAMMNQVERFVSLATEMQTKEQSDALALSFLKTCMETLASFAGLETIPFCQSFAKCFSNQAEEYVFKNLEVEVVLNDESIGFPEGCTIDECLVLVKAFRDSAVHEGKCWSSQFFALYKGRALFSVIQSETSIARVPKDKHGAFDYCITTKLWYDDFIDYFVEACVGFIKSLMNRSV